MVKPHILCHIINNSKTDAYLKITNDMSISSAKQSGLCGGLCGGLRVGSGWAPCGLRHFCGLGTHRAFLIQEAHPEQDRSLFQLMLARCFMNLLNLDPAYPPPYTFSCCTHFNCSSPILDIPSTLYLQPLRFTPRHALHLVPSAAQTHSSTSMHMNPQAL